MTRAINNTIVIQGIDGAAGGIGDTGPAGPNTVTTTTSTDITGLIKGNGANIAQAVAGVDYALPGGSGATVDDVAPTGDIGKLWFKPDSGALMIYAGGAWVSSTRNGLDGVDGVDGLGWTAGSYNSSTGIVTFTSSDGLGFTTGDLRGTVTSDSVGYTQIATSLKSTLTNNTGTWDFSTAGIVNCALSANTTITISNLQINKTLKVKLVITGTPTITFPAYCKKLSGSQTLAAGTFYLYFDCWESAGSSELVLYSITKEA